MSDPERLDPLDQHIAAALQADGRASFTGMAADLGGTEATVRKRVRRLLDDGTLALVTTLNVEASERVISADLAVATVGDPLPIGELIAQTDDVTWVTLTTGRTPIKCSISCFGREAFDAALTRVAQIDGVLAVETSVWLDIIKSAPEPIGSHYEAARTAASWLSSVFDPVDTAIVQVLLADPRASYKMIATRAGISEPTARKRTRRLLDDDLVRVKALLGPDQAAPPLVGGAVLDVLAGDTAALSEEVREWADVRWACRTTGSPSLLIGFESDDLDGFLEVSRRLRALRGTRAADVYLVLQEIKDKGIRPGRAGA
jgi:Lrp/AsnC family transcriptional regulator for asnA, asnC and gidA